MDGSSAVCAGHVQDPHSSQGHLGGPGAAEQAAAASKVRGLGSRCAAWLVVVQQHACTPAAAAAAVPGTRPSWPIALCSTAAVLTRPGVVSALPACSFQRLVFTSAAKIFSSTYRVMVEGEGDAVGYLNPLLAIASTVNVSKQGQQPGLRAVTEDMSLLDRRLTDRTGVWMQSAVAAVVVVVVGQGSNRDTAAPKRRLLVALHVAKAQESHRLLTQRKALLCHIALAWGSDRDVCMPLVYCRSSAGQPPAPALLRQAQQPGGCCV